MIFSVEGTKSLIYDALSALSSGKVTQLGLLIQSGDPIELNSGFASLKGFLLIHGDSGYGLINPEYRDLLIEAIDNRLLKENAMRRSLEEIIYQAFLTKAALLNEIVIGINNNQVRGTLVPSVLTDMFFQSSTDKDALTVRTEYYDVMRSVVSSLYLELQS